MKSAEQSNSGQGVSALSDASFSPLHFSKPPRKNDEPISGVASTRLTRRTAFTRTAATRSAKPKNCQPSAPPPPDACKTAYPKLILVLEVRVLLPQVVLCGAGFASTQSRARCAIAAAWRGHRSPATRKCYIPGLARKTPRWQRRWNLILTCRLWRHPGSASCTCGGTPWQISPWRDLARRHPRRPTTSCCCTMTAPATRAAR